MQHYYTSVGSGPFWGKVYTYDPTGNKEIVVWKSDEEYKTEFEAQDAAIEWAEANNLEVELG